MLTIEIRSVDSNLTLLGVWDVFNVFSSRRPMRPSNGCQPRWNKSTFVKCLKEVNSSVKDTQIARKGAILAWVGKGQHTGWKHATSAYVLLYLLLVFLVKSSHSLRRPKVYVVKMAGCWRTWPIPSVHLFRSAHLLEKYGPHSYVSLLLTNMYWKPTMF